MSMSGADWASIIAGVGGTAATIYANSRRDKRNAEIDEQELEQSAENNRRNTALQESLANPFRHQRDQLAGLYTIDRLRQFGSGGARVTPPANVAPYTGRMAPGYRPSPSMTSTLDALEASLRRGQGAPTMTDPANYGRTGAVNIDAYAQNGQPSLAGLPGAPASATPRDPMSYLPSQEYRRNEGAGGMGQGALKGASMGSVAGPYGAAAGLVGGAIAGAFTKNARTAMTDVSVDQARQILDQVYQEELGRSASKDEIDAQLAGQGLKPGDRWVGEAGLLAVIRGIQNSQERRSRAA